MMYFGIFIFFITGLIFGSFINMAVYRYKKGKNFFGRSYCDYCKSNLSTKALIPFLSYFFLNGKSECCGKQLDKLSPFIELITGFTFVIIFLIKGFQQNFIISNFSIYIYLQLFLAFILALILIFSFKYDFLYMEIPFKPILGGYIIYIVYLFNNFLIYKDNVFLNVNNNQLGKYLIQTDFVNDRLSYFWFDQLPNIYFAVFVFIFFFILFVITKGRGMGFADVYTAPLLSLIAGFPNAVVFLFSSFFVGALFGVTTILLKKNKLKSQIPFGPFLILGLVISLLFGNLIVKFYLELIIL